MMGNGEGGRVANELILVDEKILIVGFLLKMFVLNQEQRSEASTFTAQAANVSLEWTENFLLETQVRFSQPRNIL